MAHAIFGMTLGTLGALLIRRERTSAGRAPRSLRLGEPFLGRRGQTEHAPGTLYLPQIDCDALTIADQTGDRTTAHPRTGAPPSAL